MGPFQNGWTEADVEAMLGRGDPAELLYVPIAVGMNAPDCDRKWAEDICLSLAQHPHWNVRGNAVLGLGHIGRTCGELDEPRVLPVISAALTDPNEFVKGQAEGAAAMLEMHAGILVPGYDGEQTRAILAAIEKLRNENEI